MPLRKFLLCLAVFCLPLMLGCAGLKAERAADSQPADARQTPAEKTQYLAIFIEGKKVGHAVTTRKVAGDRVLTSIDMEFTVSRMGTAIRVRQSQENVETIDGRPLGFRMSQDMGLVAARIEGAIGADGRLKVTTTSGLQQRERVMDWPKGALLSEGIRLYELKKGLKEGTTYKIGVFEPSMLKVLEMTVKVGARRKVDLLGRAAELTEVETTVTLPLAGDMTTATYVNDDMDALKTVTPMLGMKLEMVECTKEVALSKSQPVDFFDRFMIPSPRPLPGFAGIKAATYHLAPTAQGKLAIPGTDSQKVAQGEGGVLIVTVRPARPAPGAKFPYAGDDKAALEALKPSRYVESDDKQVIALARKAVGDTKDAAEAVRRIEKFVRKYVKAKNLSVVYASAAEVAAGRQGDCSEHAVLAAALCRAVGIPSVVVCGVAYVEKFGKLENVFGPHAWAQAYVGGKWVDLDATLPGGFDAGHIALSRGNGDPEGFFGAINTLGCFKIAKIAIEQ